MPIKSQKKYHKPNIESEKGFEVQTNTGISPACYCTSAGGHDDSCGSSSNDSAGF